MLEDILIRLRNSEYYQRAISDGSTVVDSANNWPCCASGGSVLTWADDGTARTNSPASWIPKKGESEFMPGSPCLWTNDGGPGPGGKPVTFLQIERRRHQRAGAWRKLEVGTVRPYGNPKPEIRSAQVTDRTGEPIRNRRTQIFCHSLNPNWWGGKGNLTNRLQLQGKQLTGH